jgi:MerR family Zn(II)-responsive transcriptional regulator of zntA
MYRIGELAKACGVKADTLRFYEKNGLISPGIRNESGYRLYGEQDRRRLEFIIRAKSVGFSSRTSASCLPSTPTRPRSPARR